MEPKIVEHIGIISTNKYGWSRELNLVRYGNDDTLLYDIREWSDDHKKYGDGITLNGEEINTLASMVVERFLEQQNAEELPKTKATVIDFETRKKKADVIEFPF